MGLNRSFPIPYAESAQKVLHAAPDRVLAEHGGPFEFNAEDFRRRVEWGRVSARAADAVCLSGNHRHDWDLHRVRVEPVLCQARPGGTVQARVVVTNALGRPQPLNLTLDGRGMIADQAFAFDVPAKQTREHSFSTRLSQVVQPGRHVFVIRADRPAEPDDTDGFMVVDVAP
jgi:hypothetical protein